MFYRFCIRLSFENMCCCCCCCCLLQWGSSSYCKYSSLVYILYKLRSWPKYNVYIIYKPFIRPNDSLHYLCPFQGGPYSCLLMSAECIIISLNWREKSNLFITIFVNHICHSLQSYFSSIHGVKYILDFSVFHVVSRNNDRPFECIRFQVQHLILWSLRQRSVNARDNLVKVMAVHVITSLWDRVAMTRSRKCCAAKWTRIGKYIF